VAATPGCDTEQCKKRVRSHLAILEKTNGQRPRGAMSIQQASSCPAYAYRALKAADTRNCCSQSACCGSCTSFAPRCRRRVVQPCSMLQHQPCGRRKRMGPLKSSWSTTCMHLCIISVLLPARMATYRMHVCLCMARQARGRANGSAIYRHTLYTPPLRESLGRCRKASRSSQRKRKCHLA
jgi:hypothetical protein